MTELDAQLARRKLAAITHNLDLLAAVEGLSLADYRADPFRRKGTERLLQEVVEADRAAPQSFGPTGVKTMTARRRLLPTLTRDSRRADIVPMALRLLKGPFTVDAYQRLAELGVLREADRVELIDGQVVAMTPIGDRHAACVRRLIRLCARTLLDLAVIDAQNPVVLGTHNAPQPDLALLKPRADAYSTHPRAGDVLLVIEVADTSVAYDRDIKIPLYARAGIPEAWLVHLPADRIETYRDPVGGQYATIREASPGDLLTPLRLPNVTFRADAILG